MENVLDHIESENREILKWTRIDKVAVWMAITSFSIGTLLLFTFIISKESSLALIGLYYVIAAATVNTLMFLSLVFHTIKEPWQKSSHLKAIGILLINIPITILYISIVFSSPF